MNTYLVTGANGFVGTHLRTYIEERGDVFVGVPRHIFMDPLRLERFAHDVKPDVIVHAAAYGNHYKQKDVLSCLEVNYTASFNLLQVTQEIPYKAFINISTSSVTLPHQTFYSATKMGVEYLCKAFASEFKKPIVTLRPYSLYGEGEADFRFIPTVFRSCLEVEEMTLAPEPVHDWTYVGDFVKDIYETSKSELAIQVETLGFGTGVATSNQEVVNIVEGITGKKANIKRKKSLRSFDSKDWAAPVKFYGITNLEQGLKRYYEWYLSKGGELNHNGRIELN